LNFLFFFRNFEVFGNKLLDSRRVDFRKFSFESIELFFFDIPGVERLCVSFKFEFIEDFLDVVVLFELVSSLEVVEVVSVSLGVKLVIFIDVLGIFVNILVSLVVVVFQGDFFFIVENFVADWVVDKEVQKRSRNLQF